MRAHHSHATRGVRTILTALAAVITLATVAGCGLLGGGDDTGVQNPGGTGPELSKITLGTIPIVDTAPIHMAIKKGYFKAEGLDVELKTIQGGAAGIPGLVNGDLNITFGNWVSFFAAQAKGVADLKLVSEGYQARPGMFLIMTSRDSAIRTAR